MSKAKFLDKGRITPLTIIASFLGVAETVTGVVATQVSDGVQIAMTVFVVGFPVLVLAAFFAILWNRPWVFYSPAEYGGHDAKTYVDAMRQRGVPTAIADKITTAESKPEDEEPRFSLIDSLIDEPVRQHLILMDEQKTRIPFSGFFGPRYEIGSGLAFASGSISGQELCKNLNGTELIELSTDGPSVVLTDIGHRFAKWLVNNERKAAFMKSDLGGWGQRPEGWPPEFQSVFNRPPGPHFGMPRPQTPDTPTPQATSPTTEEKLADPIPQTGSGIAA
jgi:hypothetical protein